MTQSANTHACAISMLPMRTTGTSSHQLDQLQAVQKLSQLTCLQRSLRAAVGPTGGREGADVVYGLHRAKMSTTVPNQLRGIVLLA